jgi:hypothetical protein
VILKRDNLKLGLILGLLAPVLGLIVYYFIKFRYYSFMDFLRFFLQEKAMITAVGSLCLLANVALFTFYINSRRDQTAKGIFIVTLVYGIGMLLLKILR